MQFKWTLREYNRACNLFCGLPLVVDMQRFRMKTRHLTRATSVFYNLTTFRGEIDSTVYKGIQDILNRELVQQKHPEGD